MTSKRPKDILRTVLRELEQDRCAAPLALRRHNQIDSLLKIARDHYRNNIEHLFDMLPIVWGVDDAEFETLLSVPAGWLAAYRTHDVTPNDETWEHLQALFSLHLAMRIIVEPRGYAAWLRRPWSEESALSGRCPLDLLMSRRDEAVTQLVQICWAQ